MLCDAPFSASFSVLSTGHAVTSFRSDAMGRFTVFLAPGGYTIVPNTDAPILTPGSQAKSVIVEDTGVLTMVNLSFDTGIR
jgi:hypothetical protein